MSLKIAIVAGEPSGDMLGAQLITGLNLRSKEQIQYIGIGGEHMKQCGFNSSVSMDILSVGGYGLEVFVSLPKIISVFYKILKEIIAFKPDVFIGIDAPDFNLRLEQKLKQNNIRTIHYVSPTIWGWRYERINKIRVATDLMLCIFPMEQDIYIKENIRAKFVGHPLANKIPFDIDVIKAKFDISKLLNFSNNIPIIVVLVGSRMVEIERLGPIFIQACNLIQQEIKDVMFLFPFATQSVYDAFSNLLKHLKLKINFNFRIVLNNTSLAIRACDLALVKSGTVSLEVALNKKPMVISYKVTKFTEWLIRKKLKVKYVGMPNILLNEEVVEELLQDDATPINLSKSIISLYNNKDLQEKIINKFYQLHHMLFDSNQYKAVDEVINFIYEK